MLKKPLGCTLFFIGFISSLHAQYTHDSVLVDQSSTTLVIFRTFDIFNFKFSYRLFANDSLLGRIKELDVLVVETDRSSISLHASLKAPSLNSTKKSGYMNVKRIAYPLSLQPGNVYFVQCGFLKANLFNYPRQPTIRLIKGNDIAKYLRKGFIRRKLKRHLYHEWLTDHDLLKYTKTGSR